MTKESISYKAIKTAIIITGGSTAALAYFLFLHFFPYTETVYLAMPSSIVLGVALNILGIEILERKCSP